MATNFKIETKENRIIVPINLRLYPMEALYGAAYVFLDRAYLFLEGNDPEKILVYLKGKKKLTQKELRDLAGEFGNELINYALRNKISKNNQKIREYIVARALAIRSSGEQLTQKEQKWEKDNLDVALPWDQKYKIK